MAIREDFQRARTDREKEARRSEILDAAEDLLLKSGNERFAVSAIAARVGISKSTVFLYFGNKEELLLAVYERAFRRSIAQLGESLTEGMSGRAFCEAFIDSMVANPSMLILRAQLARTIERNVALESMVSSKQRIYAAGQAVAAKLDKMLDLESGCGMRMLMTLINLTAGAVQVDSLPYFDPKTLPDDVAELLHTVSIRNIFMSGAELIFCGATGRPFD